MSCSNQDVDYNPRERKRQKKQRRLAGADEHDIGTRMLDFREGLDEYFGRSTVITLAGPRTTVKALSPWLDKLEGQGNALYKVSSTQIVHTVL